MATQAWAFGINHQSDAGFRAWGADFSSKLAAVGLVQTADTGQIDWNTVTRPAINTQAGYEVWRFNDSLQATAPVYIKFIYGTGASNAARPAIWWTIGNETNGAGGVNFRGNTTVRTLSGPTAAAIGTTKNSYMVYVPSAGFFAFIHGVNAISNMAHSGGFIARSMDATEAITGEALLATALLGVSQTIPPTLVTLFYSGDSIAELHTGIISCIPTDVDTVVDGKTQAFVSWWVKLARPMPWVLAAVRSEHPIGQTFAATALQQQRTYLSIEQQWGQMWNGALSNTAGASAILWE